MWQAVPILAPPEPEHALQVSVNDFIVRAVALALTDVPAANAQWDAEGGEIVPCPGVDIAIAVATDKGLITPIVKDAAAKSLTQISAEVRAQPAGARSLDLLSLGGHMPAAGCSVAGLLRQPAACCFVDLPVLACYFQPQHTRAPLLPPGLAVRLNLPCP